MGKKNEKTELMKAIEDGYEELAALAKQRRELEATVALRKREVSTAERRLDVLCGRRAGGRPQGLAKGGTRRYRVYEKLNADRTKVWTPPELAAELSEAPHNVGVILHQLWKSGHIERIRRGKYIAAMLGVALEDRPDKTGAWCAKLEDIIRAIADDSEKVWTTAGIVKDGFADNPRDALKLVQLLRAKSLLVVFKTGVYVAVKTAVTSTSGYQRKGYGPLAADA